MVPAVRPLRLLSTARGCVRIDSRLDTAKIGSTDRVEVHHAPLLAVIGVRKTFPHGLDPKRPFKRLGGVGRSPGQRSPRCLNSRYPGNASIPQASSET